VRSGIGFWLLVALAGHSLGAQSAPPGKVELEASIAATNAAIIASCPHPTPNDRAALLRDEMRHSDAARRSATVHAWYALGCVRALLYATEAIGREGLLMPPGTSWHEGAAMALLKAQEVVPGHDSSATLLAELGMAEIVGPPPDRIAAALIRARDAGVRNAIVLRGCSEFARRERLFPQSAQCTTTALEAGQDSVWQLLQASRLAFLASDSTTGALHFHRAIAAAHDSVDWTVLEAHLRWFLEPGEELEWRALAKNARVAWLRDRLAARDIRDGRAAGSRIAEHFSRLEMVDSSFRRALSRRQLGRFLVAATPESGVQDYVGKYWEPGLVPAAPFRFFKGVFLGYDDRAAVWMRLGAPSRRIDWSSIDTAKAGRDSQYHVNTREVWQYRIDGQHLLLNFEAEHFDGSSGAGRLVAGVLGSYLCDVDTYRCNLTNRASTPGFSGVPPERIAELRADDEKQIREATTKDDNSVRVEHPVATVAQFSRVWDPRSGATLAVIPYAFKVGDLERSEDSTGISATIALTLRQWDAGAASWQSTDVIRRLRLPDRLRNNSHLTGYLVTPTTAGTSAWSLVATQGADRRGRAWADRLAPLTTGDLAMSDLVLGAESQGQTWTTTGGTQVPLGPLGAFDKDAPISLYWQVRSTTARDPVRIAVAIFRVGARDTERPVLEVGFDGRLNAGLTEWQRDIGVAQLDGGTYRIEVTVRDGEASAVRSARLLLR
jgi:hypothetical protein